MQDPLHPLYYYVTTGLQVAVIRKPLFLLTHIVLLFTRFLNSNPDYSYSDDHCCSTDCCSHRSSSEDDNDNDKDYDDDDDDDDDDYYYGSGCGYGTATATAAADPHAHHHNLVYSGQVILKNKHRVAERLRV